ncbi:hypothetical protein [Streptomyces sp. NPDC058401]|uniref:hypothetical protein n=1 Tax=Streptomyces sp. NPDC058401 TaxID=3346480 RepID=UPI00365CD2FA
MTTMVLSLSDISDISLLQAAPIQLIVPTNSPICPYRKFATIASSPLLPRQVPIQVLTTLSDGWLGADDGGALGDAEGIEVPPGLVVSIKCGVGFSELSPPLL